MPANDLPISTSLDDARKGGTSGVERSGKRILDELYDAEKRDPGNGRTVKLDSAVSNALHERGLLPGLVITDDPVGVKPATGSDGGADASDANQPITSDRFGRIRDIKSADGSSTTVDYHGEDPYPCKVTVTLSDGTTITYKRDGGNWSETVQTPGGESQVNENIDSVKVSPQGDVTVVDGSVTQIRHQNGSVDVTAQHGDDGPVTKAHYQYDESGALAWATRINPDGTVDNFSRNRFSGEWQMSTYDRCGQRLDVVSISGLTVNLDGGITYDAGNAHVVVEGYGATHITETTSYGTYEQSFDPAGNLTTIVRKDTATGMTELITNIDGQHQALLVYPTGQPEAYYMPEVTVNPDGSYSYIDSTGNRVERGVDFSPEVLEQTPIDPAVTRVAAENGVNVSRSVEDGKFVYHYSVEVNGETIQLFTGSGDATADSAKLLEMRDQKLEEVEKQYNVKIGRDGEMTDVDGEQVPLKTPNLGQMYGVESSVQRSAPDVVRADGKPVEIDFTARQGKNPNKGGFADGSRVVIEPNGGISTPDQVMRVFMHELAHNGQFRLYGDDKTYETSYAAQLGYVKAGDTWLLVTKDGRYFKSIPNEGGVGSSGWARTDKDGNPLDADGNPSANPQIITNEEAADIALVKPATGYFPNPAEAGAEATAKFRGGEETRAELLACNPDLYEVIKKLDQLDINKTYGLDESGQPKFIRNADGLIVPNTPENLAQVQQFEDAGLDFPLGDLGGLGGTSGQKTGAVSSHGHSDLAALASNIDYLPALSLVS